jgi:hypothetical protein
MHPPWKLLLVDFREFGRGIFRCSQMLLTLIAPGPGAEQDHLLDPVAKSGYQAGLGFVQDFVAFFQPSFFVLRVSFCPFHTNPIALTAQEELLGDINFIKVSCFFEIRGHYGLSHWRQSVTMA